MSNDKNIVFHFGQDSDNENVSKHSKSKEGDDDVYLSDIDSKLSHIQKIDLYDRLNFKRLAIKRNSRKGKTEMLVKNKFNIEKFTEDITKITEDIPLILVTPPIREKERKKTIRFANKRVTFQYPKEREELQITSDKETRHQSDEEELDLELDAK
jgi:hypothetical protein